MARLQAAMLESETPPALSPLPADERDHEARFGRFAPSCLAAVRKKPFGPEATDGLNRRLAERWPEIRRRLRAVTLPLAELDRVMRAAGVAQRAADLGIDPAFYRRAVGEAHEIRDRYSFLDLAAQSGRLAGFAAGEG
jgi:glycerol-1-phosphate dehydrogenase [NAD(P)+]